MFPDGSAMLERLAAQPGPHGRSDCFAISTFCVRLTLPPPCGTRSVCATVSSSSMNCLRELASVVLPEPVPPETSVLIRHRPMILRISAPSGVMGARIDVSMATRRSVSSRRTADVATTLDCAEKASHPARPAVPRIATATQVVRIKRSSRPL